MEYCGTYNLQKWLDQRRELTEEMDEQDAAIENR
jgi:hypothetical protein